jgi:ABC-type multidrug transport system fused ATPase/permease subunit
MVIVFPTVTQLIVDRVIGEHQPQLLLPLVSAGLAAFIAQEGLNSLRIFLNNHFEQHVILDLRSDLYSHIQKLPLGWFDNRATGDIMTRLVEDVTSVERVLIDGIEQGIVAILQIVIVVAVMLSKSPTLTLAALVPIPFLTAGALAYTLTAYSRYKQQRNAASALNSLVHDNIAGIRQIKTYTSEEREHTRFNTVGEELRRASLLVMRTWAIYSPSMNLLTSAGFILIAGYGAHEVLSNKMDLGVLVAFLVLARFLYEPVSRLHGLNQLFQAGRVAGERIFSIMDEAREVDAGKLSPTLRGDVAYNNVSFHYTDDRKALDDVSLHAKPGEMIALVGPTGAGKSTIVNLLVRFYEFSGGNILLDGTPIRDITRHALRENIALVTQESFLFNGTTAENLRIGKPNATEAEMWEALEAANAAEFVRRLPKGIDSQLGERGVKLSVGEKQRISIARALLKNPPILILDEATASVDTATERLIQEALDRLMAHRTSFVIAHRLSTVRHADQILVLDRGHIIERGTHEELVLSGGLYADLCRHMTDAAEDAAV